MRAQIGTIFNLFERHIAVTCLIGFFSIRLCAQEIYLPNDFAPNVKDYGAVGNGVTDDTQAILNALADGREEGQPVTHYYPRPRTLYFPKGTYLVDKTLEWIGQAYAIQGQGVGATIIKLRNGASGFGSVQSPKAVLKTQMAGNYSHRQNVRDLTIDLGQNNPGAIGIDFIANNSGAIVNVEIIGTNSSGFAGIDMSREWPGPCLLKGIKVIGCQYGIKIGNPIYGITMEKISLENQGVNGIWNNGNILSINQLSISGSNPAIKNQATSSQCVVLNSTLSGSSGFAIENEGYVFADNCTIQGFSGLIQGTSQSGGYTNFSSTRSESRFEPIGAGRLGLAIKETPEFHESNPQKWGRVIYKNNYYFDKPKTDSLIATGISTLYMKGGASLTDWILDVPPTLRRIVGFHTVVNNDRDTALTIRINEPSNHPLIIEQIGYGVRIEHNSSRTVVFKHGKLERYEDSPGAGELFMEDVVTGNLHINHNHNVWIRQFNTETLDGSRTRCTNIGGGAMWVLGIKTEGLGTVISTQGGSQTEVLGGLIYPVREFNATENENPAFEVIDSKASFTYGISGGQSRMYRIQIKETRNGQSREFLSSDMSSRIMPIYSAFYHTLPTVPGMLKNLHSSNIIVSKILPFDGFQPTNGNQKFSLHGRKIPIPSKLTSPHILRFKQ